jgi:hypothetical protein
VELAVNNVGVAVYTPLNTRLVAMRLFFDQSFLRDREVTLSTFLLGAKALMNSTCQPVDKSVVKLWKDSAEGRSYWRGAIVGLARSG